jgi:hypothetical protein
MAAASARTELLAERRHVELLPVVQDLHGEPGELAQASQKMAPIQGLGLGAGPAERQLQQAEGASGQGLVGQVGPCESEGVGDGVGPCRLLDVGKALGDERPGELRRLRLRGRRDPQHLHDRGEPGVAPLQHLVGFRGHLTHHEQLLGLEVGPELIQDAHRVVGALSGGGELPEAIHPQRHPLLHRDVLAEEGHPRLDVADVSGAGEELGARRLEDPPSGGGDLPGEQPPEDRLAHTGLTHKEDGAGWRAVERAAHLSYPLLDCLRAEDGGAGDRLRPQPAGRRHEVGIEDRFAMPR